MGLHEALALRKPSSDLRRTTARICNIKSGEILCKLRALGRICGKGLMVI